MDNDPQGEQQFEPDADDGIAEGTDRKSPPEWCPLFPALRCDQVAAIEVYGMATDKDGKATGVLLGSAAPETTAEDILRDFGGGRFELKSISHRGANQQYHKIRGLHLPGDAKWKDSVTDLDEPKPTSRTGSLLGANRPAPAHSPYGPGAGPYGPPGAPGYPRPPVYPGAPGAPGAPPPSPYGMGGGSPYGGAPSPYAASSAGPVVPIPKEGGVAPGLPPQQAQAVIEREMEERRSREDQRILMESQERAIDRTVQLTATMAQMFRGEGGSNDQRIQWYAGELQRKNGEIDQVRMSYNGLLQQKEQEIFQLRQQLIQATQTAQTEVLRVQQENLQLKSQIDGLHMQMRMGAPPDKGPSPMLQMAGPAISALASQPAVGNAVANLLGAVGKLAGGGGGAPPAPSLP